MNLSVQRRLAAKVMKCSPRRVWFDSARLSEIKEAITTFDIQSLIKDGAITERPIKGIARGLTRHMLAQKRKGRRRGQGSRKGHFGARSNRKKRWTNLIRAQRELLEELREKGLLRNTDYRALYRKAKGGYFRSKRHIKLFIEENKLLITKK